MKTQTAAAAALICCACTGYMHGDAMTGDPPQEHHVRTVNLAGSSAAADSMDIFVYDDDMLRRLDTYQRCGTSETRVKVASTSGAKIIAFLANGSQGRYFWTANNSFSYIEGLEAEFIHDRSTSPLCGGICRSGGSGSETSVTITPLMSRIVIRNIRADFKGRAYEGEVLTGARAYLTNASSVCRIFQEDDFVTRGTLNTGGLSEDDLGRMDEPAMLLQALPDRIGRDFVEPGIKLFCYPNTNAAEGLGTPFTRLVIEGRIEGRLWYWPISINRDESCWVEGTPGIGRGKSYIYDITIRRTGSTDPDIPATLSSIEVETIVEPWTEEGERDEIF